MSRSFQRGDRRIRVWGVRRQRVDTRRLSQALLEYVAAQAEKEAQEQAKRQRPATRPASRRRTPPKDAA